MQTNDVSAFHSTEIVDDGAGEHPAGRISLGGHGGLGQRSRLLRVSEGDAGNTGDLPWTTMTII